jgi:hypothetical protein
VDKRTREQQQKHTHNHGRRKKSKLVNTRGQRSEATCAGAKGSQNTGRILRILALRALYREAAALGSIAKHPKKSLVRTLLLCDILFFVSSRIFEKLLF